MPQIAILISLLVSLGLFIRGGVMLWKTEPFPDIKSTKNEKIQPGTREQKPVIFFPQVPQQPPNLRDGYLFNENRALIEEDPQAAAAEEPVVEEAPAIDLEGLEFVGSIITKTVRKAMVLYQPVEDVPQPPPTPQPQVRGWRQPHQGAGSVPIPRGAMPPMNAMPVPSGEKKHAILNEGEEFQGFLVLGVFPDKLVLEKDGNRYEKTLYVPGKARAGGEGGGMPQAAVGGGESRSRTIGGNTGSAPMQMPGGGGRGGQPLMPGNAQVRGRMPQVSSGMPGQPGVPANIVPPAPVPHSVGQAPIYGNFPQGSPPIMVPNQNRPNQ